MADTTQAQAQLNALLSLINSAAQEAIAVYAQSPDGIPTLDVAHPSDTKPDSLTLRKAVRTLEGACDQLCATLAQPAHTVANRAMAHFEPACIRVAIEARIADILVDHPKGLHVNELSKKTGIDGKKLGRVLRLLATSHCFREVASDVFANNRLSLVLTADQSADIIGYMSVQCSKGSSVLYEALTDPQYGPSEESSKAPFMYYALKEEGFNGNMFDWLRVHPEIGDSFGRAMIQWSNLTNCSSSIDMSPWKNLSADTTVCDIGGGVGSLTLELARVYPHLKLTLQDLPETIERAKKLWNTACPQAIKEQRISFVPLDFLKELPVAGQDIYCIKNVIHNWSDPQVLIILRGVRKVMRNDSRLFIQDVVLQHLHHQARPAGGRGSARIQEAPEPLLPNYGAGSIRLHRMDMTMCCMLGAKERVLEESIALGADAGLKLQNVWDLSESSLLEFVVADVAA